MVCICSAPTDDVSKVSVILSWHHPNPFSLLPLSSPLCPPLRWSLACSLSLNFLVFLYLISYPDSSFPSFPLSLHSSFSVSLSSYKICPSPGPLPPIIFPYSSSSCCPLCSVWLFSVIKHSRSDTDGMWGQTRIGSYGAWAAPKTEERGTVRTQEGVE